MCIVDMVVVFKISSCIFFARANPYAVTELQIYISGVPAHHKHFCIWKYATKLTYRYICHVLGEVWLNLMIKRCSWIEALTLNWLLLFASHSGLFFLPFSRKLGTNSTQKSDSAPCSVFHPVPLQWAVPFPGNAAIRSLETSLINLS